MSPEDLGKILEGLPTTQDDPRVLVGFESADDAGVYRLDDDRALVLTVDVITPLVDDPRDFGRIAAANAISDVYAMGGRPLAALNVSGFAPSLPAQVYRDILAGAWEVSRTAGLAVVGGHTIKDEEIKFGMAVVGEVHPDRILGNTGAREGDVLVLTKELGTSALATAFKNDAFGEDDPRYKGMIASMTRLNREAAALALGDLGDPSALPALVDALGDDESWVQDAAADAIFYFDDEQIIPVLRKALQHKNPEVRRRAAEMLSDITGEEIKAE